MADFLVYVLVTFGNYLLAALGVTGLFIARSRPRVGWWFNIAAQFAWTAYAVATRQWGFLLSGFFYTWAYIRLLRQAYATSPDRPKSPEPASA